MTTPTPSASPSRRTYSDPSHPYSQPGYPHVSLLQRQIKHKPAFDYLFQALGLNPYTITLNYHDGSFGSQLEPWFAAEMKNLDGCETLIVERKAGSRGQLKESD